ncbi:MAG: hypothetical protein MK098_05590 [Marinovum sp.]|nr:hypothetical protein [Marinovum sp.]
MTDTITRPELTLPPDEAAALRAAYEGASEILEYGSGGSTVMAAEMPGKRVISVESDRAWAAMMNNWFTDNPPADNSKVEVVWSDIGPTKAWGHPLDDSDWAKYPRYPLGIWQKGKGIAPDVVLVDGRFRIGCALAAAYLTKKPITILFDDFVPRQTYHKVQEYLGPATLIGRMARFDITPQSFPKEYWLRITQFMYRP